MKFGVVIFPGSNCDQDIVDALTDIGQKVITIWHKDRDLSKFSTGDCIVLPGGFSYGDYLRCGSIARFSPVMESVVSFANEGGKVLGICNGFQILCESGLLPGVLLQNDHTKFICKNIYLRSEKSGAVHKIPIAHGEGRYYIDDKELNELEKNGNILYRYSNASGEITKDANPNGSVSNIAGICNAKGNIIGMMPHPERACNINLGNLAGVEIFEELFDIEIQKIMA